MFHSSSTRLYEVWETFFLVKLPNFFTKTASDQNFVFYLKNKTDKETLEVKKGRSR